MPEPLPVQTLKDLFFQDEKLFIGSDPEFVFINPVSRQLIGANTYISNHDGAFGTDGHSETAEIRPQASADPLRHADNIFQLFKKYATNNNFRNIYQLEFYTSHIHKNIGGHIHFGHSVLSNEFISSLEKSVSKTDKVFHLLFPNMGIDDAEYRHRMELDKIYNSVYKTRSIIVNNLDMLLSVPLMFLEVPAHAKKRKSSSYGQLNDQREQEHGIEYRTPPSWISSKRTAEGVLSLAYAIADNSLMRGYEPKVNFTKITGFRELFKNHYTELIKPFLSIAQKEVHTLPLYPKYKDQIDYIFYHAHRGTPLLSKEIKEGWHIPYTLLRNITVFTVKELINRISQALPLPKSGGTAQTHIEYGSTDYMIPQIANNINACLNQILPPQDISNNTKLYIYAKRIERGDIIVISINNMFFTNETKMKALRLKKLLQDIAQAFHFPHPIQIIFRRATIDTGTIVRMGIGRQIREQSTYLAEALVLTTLIFFNNKIYQSEQTDSRTGQVKKVPLYGASFISLFKQHLLNKTKPIPAYGDDTEDQSSRMAFTLEGQLIRENEEDS